MTPVGRAFRHPNHSLVWHSLLLTLAEYHFRVLVIVVLCQGKKFLVLKQDGGGGGGSLQVIDEGVIALVALAPGRQRKLLPLHDDLIRKSSSTTWRMVVLGVSVSCASSLMLVLGISACVPPAPLTWLAWHG